MWQVARRMQRRSWAWSPQSRRLGLTGGVGLAIVVLTLIAGWILDQRGASAAERKIAELAAAGRADPVELVARGARSHRLVFLSDIHSSAVIKQFVSRVIPRIAATSGIDAVVLEVGSDLQPYIDQYFDRDREDAAVLLAHPRTTSVAGPASRAFLDVYRAIWRLNRELGPDQRIRVVAADLPGWPSSDALSPSQAARRLAEREAHMQQQVNALIGSIPGARILVLMDGLHALKTGTIVVKTGGTAPVTFAPLASRVALAANEVFSALIDAPAGAITGRELLPYAGTRVAALLEEQGVRGPLGVAISADFDFLRQPIIERKTPGVEFDISPRDYDLRTVADAYINLGR